MHDHAKTGDRADCAKIVVAVEGEPEHQTIVRDRGWAFEISEVITVEDRIGDLPHLLAGIRLARLENPVRTSDAQRRVERIRRLRNE